MRTEQYQSFRPGEATFQPQIDENSRMLALKNARPTSTMSQFNAPHVAGIRGDEPNDANLSSHDIEAVGAWHGWPPRIGQLSAKYLDSSGFVNGASLVGRDIDACRHVGGRRDCLSLEWWEETASMRCYFEVWIRGRTGTIPAGSDLMSESDEDDVVDRLQARDEERRRRIEAAQKEKEKLQVLDPSTGKPLFRPSILTQDLPEDVARAVEERQGERAGMSIGEFLYQKGLDKLREKELAAARTEKPAVRYMSKQSKEYLAKLRLRRFEQIFDYMVENQGGGEEVRERAWL